jgi:hypothetical protein
MPDIMRRILLNFGEIMEIKIDKNFAYDQGRN